MRDTRDTHLTLIDCAEADAFWQRALEEAELHEKRKAVDAQRRQRDNGSSFRGYLTHLIHVACILLAIGTVIAALIAFIEL
jgi:hypothetical protein